MMMHTLIKLPLVWKSGHLWHRVLWIKLSPVCWFSGEQLPLLTELCLTSSSSLFNQNMLISTSFSSHTPDFAIKRKLHFPSLVPLMFIISECWQNKISLTWTFRMSEICSCSLASCVHSRPQTAYLQQRVEASLPQIPSFAAGRGEAALLPTCRWCQSHLEPRWLGSCSGSRASFQQSNKQLKSTQPSGIDRRLCNKLGTEEHFKH